MEYIESELAKRYHRNQTIEEPAQSAHVAGETMNRQSGSQFPQREPAALGKLHEIDLGQEAKLQNIARTEAATRRLAGNKSPSPEEEAQSKKTRLGKDGKPWRNRRRRNSEDIERDRLVEEVLRESKRKPILPALCSRGAFPLTVQQWKCTTNPRRTERRMIRLPMIALQNSSDETSWKRYRVAVVQHDPGINPASPMRLVDPNLAVVGVLEPPCGRCKGSRARNDIARHLTGSEDRI